MSESLAEIEAAIAARTRQIFAEARRIRESGESTYRPTEGAAIERAEFQQIFGEPY